MCVIPAAGGRPAPGPAAGGRPAPGAAATVAEHGDPAAFLLALFAAVGAGAPPVALSPPGPQSAGLPQPDDDQGEGSVPNAGIDVAGMIAASATIRAWALDPAMPRLPVDGAAVVAAPDAQGARGDRAGVSRLAEGVAPAAASPEQEGQTQVPAQLPGLSVLADPSPAASARGEVGAPIRGVTTTDVAAAVATPDAGATLDVGQPGLPAQRWAAVDPASPRAADVAQRGDVVQPTGAAQVFGATQTGTSAAPETSAAHTSQETAAALLDRVLDAVEQLENRPPPRRMVVEIGDLRLTVALVGDEVSLAVAGGRAGNELSTEWQRELGAALSARGFSLSTGGRQDSGDQAAGDRTPGDQPRDGSRDRARNDVPEGRATARRRQQAAPAAGWQL